MSGFRVPDQGPEPSPLDAGGARAPEPDPAPCRMARRRLGWIGGEGLNAWPGYVDALSTLLMVIIFVLLVFVLAQAFLSVALSGRDRALDRLNRQVAELSDMLSLERGRSAELRMSLAQANRDLQSATAARDQLAQQLAALQGEQDKLAADRDALKAERDRLSARLADAALQSQAAQARAEDLTGQLAEAAQAHDGPQGQADGGAAGRRPAAVAGRPAQLDDMRKQIAELDQSRQVGQGNHRGTRLRPGQAGRADARAAALRDDLEKQAREAAERAVTEEQAHAVAEPAVGRGEAAGRLRPCPVGAARPPDRRVARQLAAVQHALDISESLGQATRTCRSPTSAAG